MAAVQRTIYLVAFGAVLYTPVTSQVPFQQKTNNRFAPFGSSFNQPQSGTSSAYLPPQSPSAPRPQPQVPSQLPVNQRNQQLFRPLPTQSQQQLPSQFLAQQTAQLPRNTDNVSGGGSGSGSGQHTYPGGTMGGDYPTRKAEKLLAAQRAAQLAAQGGAAGSSSGQHTYPDGTMGGDYPTRKAAKQLAAQRAAQQAALQTGSSFRSRQGLLVPQQQLNADAQFGGNVRGFGTQVQLGQGLSSNGQFIGNFPTQTGSFTFNNSTKPSSGGEHTYPDGTTGGDYPTHKAAREAEKKQQTLQQGHIPNSQFTGNFPIKTGTFPPSKKTGPGQHTYPDGTTGGNYPDHKAALERAKKLQQLQQGLGANTQFTGNFPVPSRNTPASGQHTYPDGTSGGDYPTRKAAKEAARKQMGTSSNFSPRKFANDLRNNQVYPPGSSKNQLYSPIRLNADTNRRVFDTPRVAILNAAPTLSTQGGQVVPRNSYDLSRISTGGNSFFTPQSGRGSGGQCFEFRDLAAGYGLSDANTDYPMDAIMSELSTQPHLARMVGYERIPKTRSSSSFPIFDSAVSFRSMEFQNAASVKPVKVLPSNKQFPPAFDKNTLHQSIDPQDRVCPSVKSTLRALTIEGTRCSVVNADYQDIIHTKCKRRECSLCGAGQGVNVCMPHYNWVNAIVYCPHWQRDRRIKSIKLYLPQGCTCNHYKC